MDEVKVVVIDDNQNLIDMLKEYFSDSSKIKIIGEAYNGYDGLELIEREYGNFDILLLDLIMPKQDGLWVLH